MAKGINSAVNTLITLGALAIVYSLFFILGQFFTNEQVKLPPNDFDQDGYVAINAGGSDCNDLDPNVYPGAYEKAGSNVDQNCDGELTPPDIFIENPNTKPNTELCQLIMILTMKILTM